MNYDRQKRIPRRDFLRKASLAIAPAIIPASALGLDKRSAPSNRITLGCIGTGNMGTSNMKAFLANSDVQVVAVCDTDGKRMEEAREIVRQWYATETTSGTYKGCEAYGDFRDLLARADIDAISVCTPDHWHAIPSIEAARAGKDIYCEKPLSYTIEEGRAMCEAVRKHNRVFQTGTQLRSMNHTRYACELIRNGRIGKIHTIRKGGSGSNEIPVQPEMPIPEWFNYDMWLGPAPWAPYTEKRCHWNFRYILDYSGGEMTDHGVHNFDIIQWALGTQHSGPVEIEGTATFPKSGLYNAATSYDVEWRYADGVRMIARGDPGSNVFEGTEGWISMSQGGMDASPKSILKSVIGPNEIHLYDSKDHHRNFLDCVKTRAETLAPCEIGHRSTTIPILANIAIELKRKLRWNPEAERFVDDPEADRLLSRAMRAPWHL
jgi:predicted dehydrogenase